MKSPFRSFTAIRLCLSFGLVANVGRAAISYWDPQGTTGPIPYPGDLSGLWEGNNWSTGTGGSATPGPFVEGSGACFGVNTGLGTPPFTVTMNANHNVAGVFDGPLAPNACNVTISGTGQWRLANAQGFDVLNASDGSMGVVTINVPIVDGSYASATTGQVVTQGDGQLFLNGANTYSGGNFGLGTGGTLLGFARVSWTGIVNFNSAQSLGTGSITLLRGSSSGFGALVAEKSGITLPNTLDFSQSLSNAPFLNLVGSSQAGGGTTFSGNVLLGNRAVNLGSGGSGNLVTLAGVISGSGSLVKFNTSTLQLSAVNTYTGPTTVSAGTLKLGIANAVASSSSVILNGGTLDAGGFNHAMGGTTLALSASSALDFSGNGNLVSFANSSALNWGSGAVLNLADWVGNGYTGTKLQFGTDGTGLTLAQLAAIEFDGNASTLGDAQLDPNGFIILVPEPSASMLGLFGFLGLAWANRHRKA